MAMRPVKIPNEHLHEQVAAAIKEYILEGGLKEGDRLPAEHDMAKMLGVSRSSVREAVRTLDAVGIVEVRNGKGVFVRSFSFSTLAHHLPYGLEFYSDDVDELVEMRRLLEVYAVKQIAQRVGEAHLQAMRSAVAEMRRKADRGEDFIDEDIRFHSAIADAANRRVLKLLLTGFWHLQAKIRTMNTDPVELHRRCEEHAVILEALERRDQRSAVYFMEVHFDKLEERLVARRAM